MPSTSLAPIPGLNTDEPVPSVILNLGLGADSSAIILRWILEPSCRDFDLSELVVLTAQTGSERPETARDNEAAILPLLRKHSIRLIQVARQGRYVSKDGTGVEVLSDTRAPDGVYIDGSYSLETEMLEAGTVPQLGGARLCSVHAKGDPLDVVIERITGGQPYRQAMGFELNEQTRIRKDRAYNTAVRTGEYPLNDWGWDRAACEAYLLANTGIEWMKSACFFCPFALSNKAGRSRMLDRYAVRPDEAVGALFMEHTSLALNPAQGLLGATRLVDLIRHAGHDHLIAALIERLNATEHALYEVRRIVRARRDDATKAANVSRSVRRLAFGTRQELTAELLTYGRDVELDDLHTRVYLRRRGGSLPTVERVLMVAPAVVRPKESDHFDRWWAVATGETAAVEPIRAA